MLGGFPQPQYAPCPECGAAVPRDAEAAHECEAERRLDFQMFQLREEVEQLEEQVETWLGSTRGRFEAWYAEHDRLRRAA